MKGPVRVFTTLSNFEAQNRGTLVEKRRGQRPYSLVRFDHGLELWLPAHRLRAIDRLDAYERAFTDPVAWFDARAKESAEAAMAFAEVAATLGPFAGRPTTAGESIMVGAAAANVYALLCRLPRGEALMHACRWLDIVADDAIDDLERVLEPDRVAWTPRSTKTVPWWAERSIKIADHARVALDGAIAMLAIGTLPEEATRARVLETARRVGRKRYNVGCNTFDGARFLEAIWGDGAKRVELDPEKMRACVLDVATPLWTGDCAPARDVGLDDERWAAT